MRLHRTYRIALFSVLLSLSMTTAAVGGSREPNRPRPDIPLDLRTYDTSKVTVNGEASIRKENDALIVEIRGNQKFTWPGVNLRPQNDSGCFDLSGGSVLAMDVTNLADYPAVLRCQIENPGANGQEFCVKGGEALRREKPPPCASASIAEESPRMMFVSMEL